MNQLDEHNTNLTSNASELLNSVLEEALKNGNEELFNELKARLNGQQSRMDSVLQTQARSTQQASADHSLLEQLFDSHNDLVKTINFNSSAERGLIDRLSNVRINGESVLEAIEQELNSTINKRLNKVITAQTIKYINDVKKDIEIEKNNIEKSNEKLMSKIDSFRKYSGWFFLAFGIVLVVPWWWLKLLIIGLGFIGGLLYEK